MGVAYTSLVREGEKMGDGAFEAFEHALKVSARDVTTLVRSAVYRRTLVRCLSRLHDQEALADFLALDNICHDLRLLIGARKIMIAIWEAREQVFDEAWRAVSSEGAINMGDKKLLSCALKASSGGTPEDIYDHIDRMLK